MKSIIIILTTFILLAGCHQNLGAGTHNTQSASNNIEAMTKGSTFSSAKESYVFLPELYSVKSRGKKDTAANKSIETLQSATSADFVQQKGMFQIYKSGGVVSENKLTSDSATSLTLYPVVLNQRTNQLGVVPGNIIVKMDDTSEAQLVSAEYGIQLKKQYAHLKTAIFNVEDGQDILEIYQHLQKDSRIQQVSIEVLENLNEPH